MIPIHFKNPEFTTIEKLYFSLELTKRGKGKQKLLRKEPKEVDDWCRANLIIDGKAYTFPDVIKADFSTLTRIREEIDNKKLIMPDKLKKYMMSS